MSISDLRFIYPIQYIRYFTSLKKEIETIVSLRVNKAINKMNLVKRDEFDVLKKMVQKLIIQNESNRNVRKPKKKKKKKVIQRKKRTK